MIHNRFHVTLALLRARLLGGLPSSRTDLYVLGFYTASKSFSIRLGYEGGRGRLRPNAGGHISDIRLSGGRWSEIAQPGNSAPPSKDLNAALHERLLPGDLSS